MEGQERLIGAGSGPDQYAPRRACQARQGSDQSQQQHASTIFCPQSKRKKRENEHAMDLRPRKYPATFSSEQIAHGNLPQHNPGGSTSEGFALTQKCLNQRKELHALSETLKLERFKQAAERDEHEQQLQTKNEQLRRQGLEIQKLRASVNNYTKQKLIMQPQQDLKDSDIALKYQNLCIAITDWEETEFGDMDNPLEDLAKIEFSSAAFELLQKYSDVRGVSKIAITHPSAGNIMLASMIHCHLQQTILDERVSWPSLDSRCETFISFIKRVMNELEPRRDAILIQIWASEIQRVLGQSPAHVNQRSRYLETQCRKLAGVLVEILSENQQWTCFQLDSLMEIFEGAAELAHQIRLSPQQYEFEIAFLCNDPDYRGVLFEADRTKYKIINAANGQALRDSDITSARSGGRIGKKLCVIHPALFRRGDEQRDDIVLTKATILARLDKPISRLQKTNTQPKVEMKIEPRADEQRSWGDWFKGDSRGPG